MKLETQLQNDKLKYNAFHLAEHKIETFSNNEIPVA